MDEDGKKLLLIINVGSTSTKIAVYENETALITQTLQYDSKELEEKYKTIMEQEDMRIASVEQFLHEHQYRLKDFDAIVTRGAILKPVPSGTMKVTEKMVADAVANGALHPVALGVKMALQMAESAGLPCLTVDPPTVDELSDLARFSGFPEIEREVQYQPLNQKRIARLWAKKQGKRYEDVKVIVVHLGGGTTVGAHDHGRIVDVNNGLLGEGPMTPERPGGIPLIPLIRECYSGQYTQEEMEYRIAHVGGIKTYIGTSDIAELEQRADSGDERADLILHAYAYQVAKEIGAMAAVLCGQVDAILLTGGVAHSKYIVEKIKKYTGAFAPIDVYPGGDEFGALAEGAMNYLQGKAELIDYDSLPGRRKVWN